MPSAATPDWSDVLRQTLARYDEPLLRRVAARLIKPRNQWPADELVARCAATADDVTIIDRRLRELDSAGRPHLIAPPAARAGLARPPAAPPGRSQPPAAVEPGQPGRAADQPGPRGRP